MRIRKSTLKQIIADVNHNSLNEKFRFGKSTKVHQSHGETADYNEAIATAKQYEDELIRAILSISKSKKFHRVGGEDRKEIQKAFEAIMKKFAGPTPASHMI